jgi:hypothetical protein
MKNWKRWIDLLPLLLVFGIILAFSVEVPFSDDWDLVPVLAKMNDGTLTFADLARPYAGHEMIFSYAFMGRLALLTHWNTVAMRLVAFALACGAWLAVRPAAIQADRLLAASVVFFGLDQAVNFLWTWQMAVFMALFCTVWALRLAASESLPRWLLAVVLAMVGSLSYGAGLVAWPVLLYLALARGKPGPRVMVVLAGLALVAAVFWANHVPQSAPPLNGKTSVGFFLTALGSPVAIFTGGLAAIAGFACVVLGCLAWKKMEPGPRVLWLASLAFALLLTLVRSREMSIVEGSDARYGTFAMLGWVAVVIGWPRDKKWIWVPVVILAACLIRDADRFVGIFSYDTRAKIGLAGLLNGTDERFQLKGPRMSPQEFDQRNHLLREWRYSLYHQPRPGPKLP